MKKLLKRQMNELKDLVILSLLRWENLTILPELSIGHHPKIKAYSLIFVLGAENLLLYHIFKPIPTPRRNHNESSMGLYHHPSVSSATRILGRSTRVVL